jgi:hypothetical protein
MARELWFVKPWCHAWRWNFYIVPHCDQETSAGHGQYQAVQPAPQAASEVSLSASVPAQDVRIPGPRQTLNP